MEDSELYRLICNANQNSYLRALKLLDNMKTSDVRRKTEISKNTYLHVIAMNADRYYRINKNDSGLTAVITLIYKLALKDCDVNARNQYGNTCLHIACFKPHADVLVQHFIRIGVDANIFNDNNCRVIHNNVEHKCWLVKDQKDAKCSIWAAVLQEDTTNIDMYMKSWVRVKIHRKRKSLFDLANETGNYAIVQHLNRYYNTNELVMAAFACDVPTVQKLLSLKSDKCNRNTKDYSQRIPKPLIIAVLELGVQATEVASLLKQHGFDDEVNYDNAMCCSKSELLDSSLYNLIDQCTVESLTEAWNVVNEQKCYINATDEDNRSYLHFIVEKYHECSLLSAKRLLIRLIFKLALEGIDVQRRRKSTGNTVLLDAYTDPVDRILIDHLVQLGVDSTLRSKTGHCVTINTYINRGDVKITNGLISRAYLPGLWTGVEDNDIERVKYWLTSLCRVNIRKSGRTLLRYSKDLGHTEITKVLEQYLHTTEFVVAALASDVKKMKFYLAMGNGISKVNAVFKSHFAGASDEWKIEFVSRPLIVYMMEYCSAEAVAFMIAFNTNLNVHYEECAPCGPLAFWAFRDEIDSTITLEIAKTADMKMRDELGATLLHKAVLKQEANLSIKIEIIQVMLEKGANVAARDLEGLTPRDYCDINKVRDALAIRQVFDDHVLNMCYIGDYDFIEQLILENYEHITDIISSDKRKSAKDLAQMRYYSELLELLNEIPKYQKEIQDLQMIVIKGDVKGFTRLAAEKKIAWGIDKRGRSILHLAILYKRPYFIESICEQFPNMINQGDNISRTPIHYAVSLRDQRSTLSIISRNNNVDMNAKDGNNLSPMDYLEQCERPIPKKLKARGRKTYNYQPAKLISTEKEFCDVMIKEVTSIQD